MNKKAYIQPESELIVSNCILMQVPESMPQGNEGDPELGEGDQLGKGRHDEDGWGTLW